MFKKLNVLLLYYIFFIKINNPTYNRLKAFRIKPNRRLLMLLLLFIPRNSLKLK